MGRAFGWCVECGQFVGRGCCWGPAESCARCADARAASGDDAAAGGFATLAAARAAVRQMDGVAAEFSAVESAISPSGSIDADAAIGAWEDAWLAAGVLRTRVDSIRNAALSWLSALPAAERERAVELGDELGVVIASHESRWQSITEGIANAGGRLTVSVTRDETRRRLARAAAPPTPVPIAAVAVAVPLPIRAPDRVTIPVAAAALATADTRLESTRATALRPEAPARTTVPAMPLSRPSHRPSVRPPAAKRPPATLPVGPAAVASRARLRPEPVRPNPSTAGNGPRRQGVAVAALVIVVGVVLAGAILAGTLGPLGRDSGNRSDRDPPAIAGGDTGEITASPSPPAPTSAPPATPRSDVASPFLFAVDLHPVGPVNPEELPITSIIGAPEVVPFPTSFDRSMRLTGAMAGVCFELPVPPPGGVSSMAFDLHLGEAGTGGTLAVTLPRTQDAPAMSLALDLMILGELDHDAWHRLVLTGDGDAGWLEVAPLGDDRPVLEAELDADATTASGSSDDACIQASLPSAEASLLVDNLRVNR